MFQYKTDLKCKGCQKELPKESYSPETKKPLWFGKYKLSEIIEWICIDCWDKGVRYNNGK